MTDLVSHLFASLLSGVLVGGASVVTVKLAVVRLQTQMEERDRQRIERDQEVDKKFDRIEMVLGLTGANGIASRVGQAEYGLNQLRAEVTTRLSQVEARLDQEDA